MILKKRQNFKWSRRKILLLIERLELYIAAGLNISKTLSVLAQHSVGQSERVMQNMLNTVEAGGSLSKAIRENLRIPRAVCNLIEHGELSGNLGRSLNHAKQLLEREDELKRRFGSAMIYPIVIGLFAATLTVGLMRGVVPQIAPLLHGLNVKLPLITRIVMTVSENIISYGGLTVLGAVIAFTCVSVLFTKSATVRNVCEIVISWLPVIGGLVTLYHSAMFFRSLGLLIDSGVPLQDAYYRIATQTTFWPLKKGVISEHRKIAEGSSLGKTLSRIKFLPNYACALVSAGEISGTLGQSLIRAANIMESDIEHALKKVTALVEPTMMILIGCLVGSVALSIMMPIYDISKVLQYQ